MRYSIAWPSIRSRRLPEAKRLAGGDTQLLGDKIDAGDHLGHRMLDLQTRVHFQEIELAAAVDELDRAGIAIAGGARDADRDVADALALGFAQGRRRRLFDDLLKAALDRTLAIKQMHDVAVRVGQDLHLDVARALDIALDIKPAVAESSARLSLRARTISSSSIAASRTMRMPLPPPPAAGLISSGKPTARRALRQRSWDRRPR